MKYETIAVVAALSLSMAVLTLGALASFRWLLTGNGARRWGKSLFALALTMGLCVGISTLAHLLANVSRLMEQPPPPQAPAPDLLVSKEWLAWRDAFHVCMTSGESIETRLTKAFEMPLPPAAANPAARLRRDQDVAQVLLGYPNVAEFLKRRFGIHEEFFGTGLANPIGEEDYSHAVVHEYLIPNYADSREGIWTWQLPVSDPRLQQTIKSLVEPRLGMAGINIGDKKRTAVIRFARFPAKFYSGRLGRTEATRVFATRLSEVWHKSIDAAAKETGFITAPKPDEVFMIWVLVPTADGEVVPASWGHVFQNLPKWIAEGAK